MVPPSEKQISFVKALAKKHNVIPTKEELRDVVSTSKFIQKYADLPTTKSIKWATTLATARKVALPHYILEEQLITSEFIETCLKGTPEALNNFIKYCETMADIKEKMRMSQQESIAGSSNE